MSDRIEGNGPGADDRAAHRERWAGELAAYALDALDPADRRGVEEHVDGCEACTARLRWMQPAVDVLPATVAPQSPPPRLKRRIMDVVEREAPAARRPWLRLGGMRLRPVLAGLAVVVLIGVAAGYAIRDGGSGGQADTDEVIAAHPEGGSGASGRLEVDGDKGMLHVTNLPPIRGGEVYQAWIEDKSSAGGAMHASSVFVVSGDGVGDVAIPHGLADARRVMITREPKGGSAHPSEDSLLTADMS
jgi:anti-sigma factor RsiW